jgi:hydrogenase-1 operon protein HyaE
MSTETTPTHEVSTVANLPVQAPPSESATSPLIERLVTHHGGTWVDETNIDAWSAQGGDCVVLFAGDPVQFPMGLDVAVVLPELRSALKQNFRIGAVQRDNEAALARRYGSQRWPTLMFLRDGQYVTTLSGMHDWEDFVREMQAALAQAPSRAPTIGIPVVNGNAASSCH